MKNIAQNLLLLCILCSAMRSSAQADYWGFNGSYILHFTGGAAPPITAGGTSPMRHTSPLVYDNYATAANYVFDPTGRILFSVSGNGIYDANGVNVYDFPFRAIGLPNPGNCFSEIEVFPNPQYQLVGDGAVDIFSCKVSYIVAFVGPDPGGTASSPDVDEFVLNLYRVYVDPTTIPTTVTVDPTIPSPRALWEQFDEGNYLPLGGRPTCGLVATSADKNNARNLYLFYNTDEQFRETPDDENKLAIRGWRFDVSGVHPLGFTLLGDPIPTNPNMMGNVGIMEAKPDGSELAYAGIGGLNVFNTTTGVVTNYPIPDLATAPATSNINGIEWVPSLQRWYVSYTYAPSIGAPLTGTIGYFNEGITTTLHSANIAGWFNPGASELELGKDNHLYFAGCSTCTTTADYSIAINPYTNPGDLYSFDPADPSPLIIPTAVPVSTPSSLGLPTKVTHSMCEKYYYINNQIDGEDYSKWNWDVSGTAVVNVDIDNGTTIIPPSGCSATATPPLQIIDQSTIELNFRDAGGTAVSLPINDRIKISWKETNACGVDIIGSPLNYADAGFHGAIGPLDLKSYGPGLGSDPGYYNKYFIVTTQIIRQFGDCMNSFDKYTSFIQIVNVPPCNSDFDFKLSGRTYVSFSSPTPGNIVTITPKEFHSTSSYTYNWGDGSAATTGTLSSANHTYTTGGSYTVCVKEKKYDSSECTTCMNFCTTASYAFVSSCPSCNTDFDMTLYARTYLSTTSLIPNNFVEITMKDPPAISATYTFNWGDGSTPTVVTSAALAPPAYANHTYGIAGPYTICVTESDEGNGTSETCMSMCIPASGSSSGGITSKRTQNNSGMIQSDQIKLYPNPTSNDVTINFTLAQKDKVQVNVLDIYGKTVINIPAQQFNAGTQKINLNSENLPSGIYLVELKIGQNVTAKKLSVVK